MGRIRAVRWIGAAGLPLALLLSGCTIMSDPVPAPMTSPAATPAPTASTAPESALSEFQRQLPLTGVFVSQATKTSGTVEIQRRADGSVWIVLDDFHTGDASDLRVYLKRDPLVQDADGYWGSSGDGYEIASIDPTAQRQEIEVPGAGLMPAMRTLTVMDYVTPDYPALGSAALG